MYIKNLNEWLETQHLNEKYLTLSNVSDSPEEIADNAKQNILDVLPFPNPAEAEKYVLSIEDKTEPEKWIKFEAKLKTKDVVSIYRIQAWSPFPAWEWHLNNKKMTGPEVREKLLNSFFTPYEQWKREFDKLDPVYHKYDDHKSYMKGADHEELVNNLYKKLSSGEKKKADKYKEMTKK